MTDETNGLNLFDDTASAVGNFPTALRGYDRTAVDDYVRALEVRVVQSNQSARELNDRVHQLEQQISDQPKTPPAEADFAKLGGRAKDILALAEDQARDVTSKANTEAAKIREEAYRDADAIKTAAERAGSGVRDSAVKELDQLRSAGQETVMAQVERAKADAAAIVAAAHREADAIKREADHHAETAKQTAYLDSEEQLRGAEAEAAAIRKAVADEREAALAQLRQQHTESVQATGALLAEATESHKVASDQIAADVTEATRVRSEAELEAEAIVAKATQDADEKVAAAQKRADAITERTHREFSWRKDQLRQETELLSQRKQAVLSQLASLSDLANQTASSFPDLQPLAEITDDLEEFEDADKTVLRDGEEADAITEAAADAVDSATNGEASGANDEDGDTVLDDPEKQPAQR